MSASLEEDMARILAIFAAKRTSYDQEETAQILAGIIGGALTDLHRIADSLEKITDRQKVQALDFRNN